MWAISKASIACLTAPLLMAAVIPMTAAEVDLSGNWVMNSEKSDSMGPPGGGRGRGGGRRRGGGPFAMTIAQDGDMLTVSREGRRGAGSYTVKVGNGPQEVEIGGAMATIDAKWEGRDLVMQQDSKRDTPMGTMEISQHQVWKLSEDGKVLTQHITMSTPRGEFERKVVFDKQ